MGAIDFRFRPVGTQSITRELTYEYPRKMRLAPAPSFERQDIDMMFREMDAAGIEMGVIGVLAPSDKSGFESTGNAAIAALIRRYLKRPYLDDCHPELVDHVATDFPELTLIIQHGGWPYSREACGLAYKQKNVYIVRGQYVHYEFPGSEDYVKGANRQLSDQMLFGSVYPNCGPLSEVMQIVDRLGFATEEVKQKYFGGNARRLLGLPAGPT